MAAGRVSRIKPPRSDGKPVKFALDGPVCFVFKELADVFTEDGRVRCVTRFSSNPSRQKHY